MSSDPNDLTALTPGHFLIGEPLTANIDPNAQPVKANLLTRWKLVSHIKCEFWRRWTTEYLNELQQRLKWKQKCTNLEPGTMVILKEDNVPVLKWPLGRIIEVYKGNDGNVRVADVRTASGILKRPIHKLSPLPIESEPLQCLSTSVRVESNATHTEPSPVRTTQREGDGGNATSSMNSPIPKKKARRSYGSSIVTLLLACIILPTIRANPAQIEELENRPGIYFDNLGKMNLISTEWKLVVYYDLRPYWTEFDTLSRGIQALHHLCTQMQQKSSCRPIVVHFQHVQDELSKDNELLSTRKISERQKRGALNIVGNVANALFGVLDSEYAEQMSKTIDNIKENEEHLITLLKNQTSVIDSTLNIIKKDQAEVERKFQALDNQITELMNRIQDTGEEFYRIKIFQLFTSLCFQTTLISSNLQRIQAAIIDVITDSHHGKINPLLLTPLQLKKEIITIKNHLPSSYKLPIDQDDILLFYTLMTAKSRIFNNYILFQLRLPLVTLEAFDLFKLVPIPALVNNTFIAIKPYSAILAINLHRDHYYTMTEQELLQCSMIRGSRYLCSQLHPIYRKGSAIGMCEMNLFNHIPDSDECRIESVTNSPIWIQLSTTNHWIYAVKMRTPTNVICGDEAFPIELKGSGLLKIPSDCIIKQDLITIHGHHVYPSYSNTSYTRLGMQLNLNVTKEVLSTSQEMLLYKSQVNEINLLKEKLASSSILELPRKIETNSAHYLSVSYTGLLLTILTIICILWKFKKKFFKRCCSPKKKEGPELSTQSEEQQNFTIHI